MRVCALGYAEDLRRSLDQDKPGWTLEMVRCPLHGDYHELRPVDGRLFSVGAYGEEGAPGGRSPARFRVLEDGRPCFHESRAPAVSGACAYCGAPLHAHKDALGRVRSGRTGAGYLEERCPACHRVNAVFPAGRVGIRVAKLAEGAPVKQLKLG